MTILETFIKLRDDLKLWVTNNLKTKADIDSVPVVDDTMSVSGAAADAAAVGKKFDSLDTVVAVDENSDGNIEIRSYLPEQDYLQLDKSLTVEGAAAEGAATGIAISKSSSPHNYLDNSDFTNAVNQRGQTTYSSGGYNIDRWTAPVMGNISLSGYGMKLVGVENDYGTQNRQRVSSYKTGKVYTFAVCDSNYKVTVVSAIPSENWAKTVNPWGEIGLAVISGLLTVNIKVAASYSKTFRWAALYEGEYTAETLPDYKPKGYGAELAECQRYAIMLGKSDIAGGYPAIVGTGTAASTSQIFIQCPIPTKMRVNPTVTCGGSVELMNKTCSSYLSVSGISPYNAQANNIEWLTVSTSETATVGEIYSLACRYGTGYVLLSADL